MVHVQARLKQHAADVKQNIKGVRLDTMVLRCLFEDAKSPKFQEAEKIDVQKLADEYAPNLALHSSVFIQTLFRYLDDFQGRKHQYLSQGSRQNRLPKQIESLALACWIKISSLSLETSNVKQDALSSIGPIVHAAL